MKRLAIIGAGPIGLEAALLGIERGFDVTVLEASRVGDGVRRWGPTRCFSPFGMNHSARLREALGAAAPAEDSLLSGAEIVERVLRPIAQLPALAGRIHEGTRVSSVGRARMSRGELAGHPLRGERSFRLLLDGRDGETVIEADRVLDASGVYGQATPFGAGPPARGEAALRGSAVRHLGALHEARARWRGRRVLLVGHGHSAAHAIGLLDELARDAPGTSIVWALRSPNKRPVTEVADDPLPERARVVTTANDLCGAPPPHLRIERRASVEAVRREADGVHVELSGERRLVVDEIVALTGYRPDLEILSELALEISAATEGAARLWKAISNVTDCLSVPAVRPQDLASGEPGFHLVGSKSYGRARTFLLSAGVRQLETIFESL